MSSWPASKQAKLSKIHPNVRTVAGNHSCSHSLVEELGADHRMRRLHRLLPLLALNWMSELRLKASSTFDSASPQYKRCDFQMFIPLACSFRCFFVRRCCLHGTNVSMSKKKKECGLYKKPCGLQENCIYRFQYYLNGAGIKG